MYSFQELPAVKLSESPTSINLSFLQQQTSVPKSDPSASLLKQQKTAKKLLAVSQDVRSTHTPSFAQSKPKQAKAQLDSCFFCFVRHQV